MVDEHGSAFLGKIVTRAEAPRHRHTVHFGITGRTTTVGDYSQYRLVFNKPDGARVYIDTITIPEWEAHSYSIDFISSEMPIDWSIGQRVTIQVPTYAAFIVDSNTFNGVKVNTILLSGRKYELTYNGTSFDAKGV